jgi:hypothetical protein
MNMRFKCFWNLIGALGEDGRETDKDSSIHVFYKIIKGKMVRYRNYTGAYNEEFLSIQTIVSLGNVKSEPLVITKSDCKLYFSDLDKAPKEFQVVYKHVLYWGGGDNKYIRAFGYTSVPPAKSEDREMTIEVQYTNNHGLGVYIRIGVAKNQLAKPNLEFNEYCVFLPLDDAADLVERIQESVKSAKEVHYLLYENRDEVDDFEIPGASEIKDSSVSTEEKNKISVPDIYITKYPGQKLEKVKIYFEQDLSKLNGIMDKAEFAPVFRPNPKYCTGSFKTSFYQIPYSSIINNEFSICGHNEEYKQFWDSNSPLIIKKYATAYDVLADGWSLD